MSVISAQMCSKHWPDLMQKWMQHPYVYLSFSEFGEDQSVVFLFLSHFSNPATNKGFYVDLGAFDPIRSSNTYMLHLMGWRGMNVDANPEIISRYRRLRPNDINIASGVSDRNEVLPFHYFNVRGASSFDPKQVERMKKKRFRELKVEDIPCRDVNELLAEYLPKGSEINYLNIDLEGYDERVALHLDLERFRPEILTVELLTDDLIATVNHPVTQKMIQSEYRYLCRQGFTSFFVDERKARFMKR